MYLVRWTIRTLRDGHETRSRVFRQRPAAVRWYLTLEAEGFPVELHETPLLEWQPRRVANIDRRLHARHVQLRVERRARNRKRRSES